MNNLYMLHCCSRGQYWNNHYNYLMKSKIIFSPIFFEVSVNYTNLRSALPLHSNKVNVSDVVFLSIIKNYESQVSRKQLNLLFEI